MNASTAFFLYISKSTLVVYLLALQPTPLWRFLGFGVATYVSVLLLLNASSGHSVGDYVVGCAITQDFFSGLYLLYFTNALDEFRHEKDVGHPRQWPLTQRMSWASRLLSSARGIGWNDQIRNLPPRPQQPRWLFVRNSLLRVVMYYVISDMAVSYVSLNPLFSPDNRTPISLATQGPVMYILNCVAIGTPSYSVIALGYTAASLITVAVGSYDPQDWPAFFGNFSDAYTLRRFWSHTWHQALRRSMGTGAVVPRLLGFRKGSKASSMAQLFVCFTISGLVHTGGDFMVGADVVGRSFYFFFIQAIAIAIEDMVIQVARRMRILSSSPLLARLLGFSWVLLWFGAVMPHFIRMLIDLGFTRTIVLPFSPVQAVLSVLDKKFGIDIVASVTAS